MKKKSTKRILSAVITATTLATALNTSIFAVTTANRTAACFGNKYHESSTTTVAQAHNFETNAVNAKNAYAQISDVTATRYTPTASNLNSKLNSNIVFLNSHASQHSMTFKFFNNSVYTVTTIGDGTSQDVSVDISDIDLSNVELISFVGCKSAVGTTNITTTAISQGAKVAIGFKDTIESRSSQGKAWLKSYNSYLAQGCPVSQAVFNATNDNPTSDLGTDVLIRGNGGITIANSTNTAARSVTAKNGSVNISVPIELQSIKNKMYINDEDVTALAEKVADYYPEFNSEEFKVTQNIFNEETKTGYVSFDYYIDDTIRTDKAYLIYIENGIAKEIVYSLDGYNNTRTVTNENSVISRMNAFAAPTSVVNTKNIARENVVSNEVKYIYSYKTDELTYLETVFYEADGVIIDEVNEVIIK